MLWHNQRTKKLFSLLVFLTKSDTAANKIVFFFLLNLNHYFY